MDSQNSGILGSTLYKQSISPAYRPIPTFVQALDNILGGGIQLGVITELYGDSGIGKTAMCIQLCLDVQIPQHLQGMAAEALFIDTENSFAACRVEEMAREFVRHCNMVTPKELKKKSKLTTRDVLAGIHVVKPKNMNQFRNVILSLIDYISKNRKIRLICIDSIAFPFYPEGDNFWCRVKPLYSFAQILHYIAGEFGVAVVLTNNLTTRFDQVGRKYFVPHLGDNWLHIPNQRIELSWTQRNRVNVREAKIVKSTGAQEEKASFRVTAAGIRE